MMKKQTKKSIAPKSRRSGASLSRKDVLAPVAVSRTMVASAPQMRSTARSCTVRHREMIGFVYNRGSSCISYAINPGVTATFPWLSSVANRWEMYRFHRLVFEYLPACPSTTAGRVAMGVDYDALDPAPPDYTTLTAYEGSVSCAVWSGCQVAVPASRLALGLPQRYTRQGTQANLDLKTYDLGNLFLWPSSVSGEGSANFAELWVSYEVELFVPQIRTSVPSELFSGVVNGVGLTAPFDVSSVLTTVAGAPLLQPITASDAAYNTASTKFRALDSIRGIISLYGAVASGDTGPLNAVVEKTTMDGESEVTRVGPGTFTTGPKSASVSFLTYLQKGAIFALTKPISTVFNSAIMPMLFTPLDRRSYASFKPEL